jgi:hypothetical protein
MGCKIIGRVIDKATGEPLGTPRLALHRMGVVGEIEISLDEDGTFAFSSLGAGEYSLSAYDDDFVYWHQALTLTEAQSIDDLHVALSRGGRIVGQVLDESGRPPHRCILTLLRNGERHGQSGFINDSGDHWVGKDGIFRSPPLSNGTYLLRFAGILQKPHTRPLSPKRKA